MKKFTIWLSGFLGAVVLVSAAYVQANPSFLMGPCFVDGLTSATTTYKYMTAGTATSTIGRTTLCNLTLNNGSVATGLSLNFFHTASSSPLSVIQANFQWSNNGQDWYSETVSEVATTTQWSGVANYQYAQIASSTDIMTGAVSATTTQTVEISNPGRARFFRAYFHVPVDASPSAIHAEVVPRKESI